MSTKKAPVAKPLAAPRAIAKKVPRTSRKNLKKPSPPPAPETKTITYYVTVDSESGILSPHYDVWLAEPERVVDLKRVVWRGPNGAFVGHATRGVVESWLGIAPAHDNQIAVAPYTYTETSA